MSRSGLIVSYALSPSDGDTDVTAAEPARILTSALEVREEDVR
jgi:hypothetical protein